MYTMVYDEFKPQDYKPNKRQRLVIWICEKLTGMKIIALLKL